MRHSPTSGKIHVTNLQPLDCDSEFAIQLGTDYERPNYHPSLQRLTFSSSFILISRVSIRWLLSRISRVGK